MAVERVHILFYLAGILIAIRLLASCEKVIEVEVNESEPRVVLEGVLKDSPGNNYILLSKTGGLYDESGFEKISGAEILVTDNAGNEYLFTEEITGSGKYTNSTFEVLPSNNYTLFTDLGNGNIISAESPSFSKPKIDSLTYIYDVFGGGPVEVDTHYLVSYHSVDPPGEVNNYRVRLWINSEESEIYYMGNDDFIDGQYYEAPFFGTPAHSGDTVLVEIISMDDKVYKYFYQLANNIDNTPFSAAPANPKSNLNGDAIGYFGVFTTDTMSMIIP